MPIKVLRALVGTAALAVAVPASAEVTLTMSGGQVTLSAKNATVAQILSEWSRVGQTRIVNAEKVGGAPLTLELKDIKEAQALEIILRSVGGYVLAPRPAHSANMAASQFDRIYVMPVSVAPRFNAPTAPPPQQATVPPRFAPLPPREPDPEVTVPGPEPAAARGAVPGAPPAQEPRSPQFATFPQPAAAPGGGSPASTVPAPGGVPVPGMVAPAPPPAQQNNGAPGSQR